MAGTVVLTEILNGTLKSITFAWTSDGSGNATATTVNSYAGTLVNVQFAPGSPTPTTAYDVILLDASAVDVLNGKGANLSSAASVFFGTADLTSITGTSVLSLSITNAGASKQGTITVFISGTSNAYCTLSQVKNLINSQGLSTDTVDDSVINDMITRASGAIDQYCDRHFYPYTETRYYNVPDPRGPSDPLELLLDEDLLSITTLTNGEGTVISASDYNLLPRNGLPKYSILIIPTSNTRWKPASSGNAEYVISLAGSWGYVVRTATDPFSLRVVAITEGACLEIVRDVYRQRYGLNTTGTVSVTAAGLVITPAAFSAQVIQMLSPLRKNSFA